MDLMCTMLALTRLISSASLLFFLSFLILIFIIFWQSLSPAWPQNCYIAKYDLELLDPPAAKSSGIAGMDQHTQPFV